MDQVASIYHNDLPVYSYTTLSTSLEGMRMQRVPQETGQIIMVTAPTKPRYCHWTLRGWARRTYRFASLR
jgi:hypothetical protein